MFSIEISISLINSYRSLMNDKGSIIFVHKRLKLQTIIVEQLANYSIIQWFWY